MQEQQGWAWEREKLLGWPRLLTARRSYHAAGPDQGSSSADWRFLGRQSEAAPSDTNPTSCVITAHRHQTSLRASRLNQTYCIDATSHRTTPCPPRLACRCLRRDHSCMWTHLATLGGFCCSSCSPTPVPLHRIPHLLRSRELSSFLGSPNIHQSTTTTRQAARRFLVRFFCCTWLKITHH